MINEEARAYFIDCNERIISVAKDENIYNYKTQQVEDVFMRRTFEANELAIKALEQDPQETVTEFADRCRECGAHYGRLLNQKWIPVSEGLPEKDKYTDFYKCMVARLYTSRSNTCDICIAYFDGKRFLSHNSHGIVSGVKAWMPLPEPYKKEGGEKE